MKASAAVDVFLPAAMSGLLTIIWAFLVLSLTYAVAKRIRVKWLKSIVGTVSFLTVMVGGIALGLFTWLVYWTGFKNMDLNAPIFPDGAPSGIDILFHPAILAMAAPILTPCLVMIPVAVRWKKLGTQLGVNWA